MAPKQPLPGGTHLSDEMLTWELTTAYQKQHAFEKDVLVGAKFYNERF